MSELGRFVEDEVEGLGLSVDRHSVDSEETGGKGSVDETRGWTVRMLSETRSFNNSKKRPKLGARCCISVLPVAFKASGVIASSSLAKFSTTITDSQ